MATPAGMPWAKAMAEMETAIAKPKGNVTGDDVAKFAKEVRSVLWRKDRKMFEKWKARVDALKTLEGGGRSYNDAVIRASREYTCLTSLFEKHGVDDWDKKKVTSLGDNVEESVIIDEGKEQSYRENLRWAIEAAGTFLRTKRDPAACPNNAAFYLFRQAIEDPKDFLAKVGQMETKIDRVEEDAQNARKLDKRSIREINDCLAELDAIEKEEEDGQIRETRQAASEEETVATEENKESQEG